MELKEESFSELLTIWLLIIALSGCILIGVHSARQHTEEKITLLVK